MNFCKLCIGVVIALAVCMVGFADNGWTAQRGGKLIYAQAGSHETFDCAVANDNMSEEVNRMIYDKLVEFTPDLRLKPTLATKWETSDDGMTWTFYIRKGVKFHDGTVCDAHAIKFNFDRWIGPEKPYKAYGLFGPIVKSAEAVDDYTIKLHMKVPFSSLTAYLAHSAAGVQSPTHFKKVGNKGVAINPVGTGAFKYKKWVKGDHVTLVRNEEYWDGPAYLDEVIIKPVVEQATRVMQLKAGQIHATTKIPSELYEQLRKDKKLTVGTIPTNAGMYLQINNYKKPFNDLRVRQAICYAIDKKGIVEGMFQGMAEYMSSCNAPIVQDSYQPHPFEYNPEKAKQLLAEAGYPNGFSCQFWTPSGRIPKDTEISQLIQRYLAAVGIKAKIQIFEWVTFLTENRKPPEEAKYDICLMKWAPSTGESRWQLYLAWTTEKWPMAGANRGLYSNPAFDKLVELGTSAPTDELRYAYFRAAQIVLAEDAAMAPLCAPHGITATSSKLHNFVFSPLELNFATNKTWLEQ